MLSGSLGRVTLRVCSDHSVLFGDVRNKFNGGLQGSYLTDVRGWDGL